MAKTLIIDTEANTSIDITGVTEFQVIQNPSSLQWGVHAIIGGAPKGLLWYKHWASAHMNAGHLTDYVIRDDVDTVIVHAVTGSIVPQT